MKFKKQQGKFMSPYIFAPNTWSEIIKVQTGKLSLDIMSI